MKNRIIFDIFVLVMAFYTPWWLIAILAFVGAFIWPMYYEIVFFGLLVDILYGLNASFFTGVSGVLCSVGILLIATYAKKAIR